MESRPRGETFYAVGRSNENTRSPLDFVSGYGLVFAPFRARPTRNFLRRAFVGTLERGNETGCMPIAARAEPVGPSPHTAPAFERSILDCLSSVWENCKGGTPFARFFPPFLAGQEMEPPEANDDLDKLQSVGDSTERKRRGQHARVSSSLQEMLSEKCAHTLIFCRNALVRACCGWSMTSEGGPCSTITPSDMKMI